MSKQQSFLNLMTRMGSILIIVAFVGSQYLSWQSENAIISQPVVITTQLLFIGLLLALAYRYWSNLFNFLLSE